MAAILAPATPLQAWECRIGQQFVGFHVAPTAGKAKAQVLRDYPATDIDYTDIKAKLYRCLHAKELIEAHEDAGKYWRDTRAFARAQALADEFNERCPVGHPVQVIGCCEADQWPDGLTFVRTPAWVTCPDRILVSVEGQAGGMYLKFIRPLSLPLDV